MKKKIEGVIVAGRGSGMRFPTATLQPRGEWPKIQEGIYASRMEIAGDKTPYEGVTSVGVAATVGAKESTIETFLFGYEGDLRGKRAALELVAYIRPMKTFAAMQAMEKEIEKDIARGKLLLRQTREE